MNKMNFYNFLKQQCYDCKNKYDLPTTCSACPCKILINEVINPRKQTDCTNDIMYLADKYNIHGFDASLCGDCAITALKIAKKMSENFNRI